MHRIIFKQMKKIKHNEKEILTKAIKKPVNLYWQEDYYAEYYHHVWLKVCNI